MEDPVHVPHEVSYSEPVIRSVGEIKKREDGGPDMRRRMCLDTRMAWQISRPAEGIIGASTVSGRMAENERREAAAAARRKHCESTRPPTRPHEQVIRTRKEK